jgi:hypothetical protein
MPAPQDVGNQASDNNGGTEEVPPFRDAYQTYNQDADDND